MALGVMVLLTVLCAAGGRAWRGVILNNRLVEAAGNPATSVNQIASLLRQGGNPNGRQIIFPRAASVQKLTAELPEWLRNADRRDGVTPLCAAACQDRPDLVRVLLEVGADPNGKSGAMYGAHPVLLDWAQSGYNPHRPKNGREVAKHLLDHGADVNAAGGAALRMAVSCHRAEAVRLLLERGANPNAADRRGWTALRYGLGNGTIEVESVRMLLEYGANVNARGADGITPLGRAVRAKASAEILTLLRNAGATE